MRNKPRHVSLFGFTAILISVLICAPVALGQTTSFVYQGRLTDGATPANGNYDLQFALWTNLSGGTQVGSTQAINSVAVSTGLFSVNLDFGANAFPGASRFLEISVKPTGSGSFTTLTPRQPINSTPYAVRSLNAATADSIPASGVPSGSANYIQNTTNPQSANFNVSGSGTMGGNLIASGFAGIGITVPQARLHVRGTSMIFDNSAGQGVFINTSAVRVGIGTSSPDSKLDAVSTDGTVAIIGTGPTRAVVGRIGEISCPGSGNRPYAVGGCGGSSGSGLLGRSSVGPDFFNAAVYAISDGGGFIFQGLSSTTVKATIDANGNLFLSGSVSLRDDEGVKQRLTKLSYGLREVLQLRPVTWTGNQQAEGGRRLGLIAQEVELVLPELVTTEKNPENTKALNYTGLTPIFINAIQEQQATISALQTENATLKAKVQEIELRLQELAKEMAITPTSSTRSKTRGTDPD